MTKILSIDENKTWSGTQDSYTWDGVEVVTDGGTWFARIDNMQGCCETWGYIKLNDESVDYFVGSDLLSVEVVDTALNVKKLADIDLNEGGIMFVNFVTSKGVMQFAVYNEHNGYYGHDAQVGYTKGEKTTLTHEEVL